VFDEIEGSDEFNNVDEEIRNNFFLIVNKTKRNYMAIQHLFNGEWTNSCIEAIPLIRTLAETYFHLCYIIDKDDPKLVATEYQALAEFQSYRVAKNIKHSGTTSRPEEKDFIKTEWEGKDEPTPPEHLKYISSLVQELKKINKDIKHKQEISTIYKDYCRYSSWVHFNPATCKLYGIQTEEQFIFNRAEENKPLFEELEQFTNSVIELIYKKVIAYLKIESLGYESKDI
jgi:hypothetical protein